MKRIVVFGTITLVALFIAGCVSPYYGQYERVEAADSPLALPISIGDVLALTRDSVSDAVIISQIEVTRSYFSLTPEDILTLKKAGVSENVISAMIKTGEQPRYARRQRRYYSSPPHYYPYYYGYPGYSSIYYGYGYYPYYFGHSSYGGHYFGGQSYGGHYSSHHGYGGYSGGHGYGGGGHGSIGGHR